MDYPWGTNSLATSQRPVCEFEDNFVGKYILPHSKEYIESCERKLAKLKNQRSNAKNLLQALAQTKQSHLERIVDSKDTFNVDDPIIFYQPVFTTPLQRFFAPEKQASTIDELYELLKYDQLGQLFQNLDQEEDEKIKIKS